MSDQATAKSLNITDPNKTWAEMMQKQYNNGIFGDSAYSSVLESSQRSRPSVNNSLGLQ